MTKGDQGIGIYNFGKVFKVGVIEKFCCLDGGSVNGGECFFRQFSVTQFHLSRNSWKILKKIYWKTFATDMNKSLKFLSYTRWWDQWSWF